MPSAATPSGTAWEVRRSALAWRVRRRVGFELDPVGLVLGVLGLILLPLEFLAASLAGAFACVIGRPGTVEAVTKGPPPRRLRWRVRGRSASAAKVEEVVRRLEAGDDPSADADERQVGP